MVKNQKKSLVAASRDELLCVALPVIHRLFGVFILQKENQDTEADAILTEHAKKLKEVLSYIDAHYMEELTISGLAGICFFSEYYFMRFFKKYMGMSCVQYIKNVRLERAADQFENGETNTLEVALACGFSNLSYFHREFKKKYGMTPKRFISLSARAADFHEGVNNYHFYDS